MFFLLIENIYIFLFFLIIISNIYHSICFSESVKSFQLSIITPVHVGPYCIGILLGYLIATKKEIKIPKVRLLSCDWKKDKLFCNYFLFTYYFK